MIHFSVYDKKKLVNCYPDFMLYRNNKRANSIGFTGNCLCPMEGGKSSKGLIHKYASIPRLYQGPQSVSLIEVDPGAGLKVDVAVSGEMKETSRIASEHHAIAAINGSYFDMKRGNSVCFLKVGDQVVDTTTLSESKWRVTGAIHLHKGK